MPDLNASSQAHLVGVEPRLVRVVHQANVITKQPFIVIEGVRSTEQMLINWGKGRTADVCLRAGVPARYARPNDPKVTWLKNPLGSNHRKMPDGFGHAVDLGAIVNGAYDGKTASRYDTIALAMMQAAHLEQVHVRWGADWDEDGRYHEPGETDMAHFELIA